MTGIRMSTNVDSSDVGTQRSKMQELPERATWWMGSRQHLAGFEGFFDDTLAKRQHHWKIA
jgi:hypothetical protein